MRRYPWRWLPLLGSRIENHQAYEAHNDLQRLLAFIAADDVRHLAVRKLRCAQIISVCLRSALQSGAASDAILQEHLKILEALAMQRTWRAVEMVMHRYVDQLLERVRPEQRTSVERFVDWMQRDMRASLNEPKTLGRYALIANLSTGHLSRRFTSLTGHTFSEYLRRLRMETACRLLVETSLKVNTIARRVGMRDTSKFIAEFRRETGRTPGAYRQSNQRLINGSSIHTDSN